MRRYHWFMLSAALLFGALLLGCEGKEGPEGPQGPEGPAGPGAEVPEYTYLGGGGEDCMHCHVTTVTSWEGTGHHEAYEALDEDSRKNLYCVQCHTTGFDSQVSFGDTVIAEENYGPDLYGFDDYVNVETEEAAARRAALEGVQCEACHGPMGPEFNEHKPEVSFATRTENDVSLSLCSPCHGTQLGEWVTSGHGTVQGGSIDDFNAQYYASSSTCQPCHTSEGFIAANDEAFADYVFPAQKSFIGCVTCHDPHDATNDHQLRELGSVEVAYHPGLETGDPEVPVFEGYGVGQICGQCHHARRDNDNVAGQISDGDSHFGPHGSPQMDMYIGNGSYEIDGYTYDRTHSHQNITEACVKCHMVREAVIHGETEEHAFHTFEPDVGNCEPCHTGLTDFDVDGLQTAIQGKMDELAQALGYTDAATMLETFDSTADGVEPWEREAAYALYFVSNDGSKGVHNPEYATDLLDNAIAYAQANKRFAAR